MAGYSPCGLFKLPGVPASTLRRRAAAPAPSTPSDPPLNFPIEYVHQYMRSRSQEFNPNIKAAVFMTAVLEYLVGEVMEVAGSLARQGGLTHIFAWHIQIAMRLDNELKILVKEKLNRWPFYEGDPDCDDREPYDPEGEPCTSAQAGELAAIRHAVQQAAFAAAEEDLMAIQQGAAAEPASTAGDEGTPD